MQLHDQALCRGESSTLALKTFHGIIFAFPTGAGVRFGLPRICENTSLLNRDFVYVRVMRKPDSKS
jgi:hypothetical protein